MTDTGSGRPLLEKLGVRPGARVEVLGLDAEGWFFDELRAAGAITGRRPPFDLVFVRVDHPDDLDELRRLRGRITQSGAIWVVRVKGKSRRLTDIEIIEAAKRSDLVDNKIASFSDALAAMRLVIPVSRRTT